MIKYVYLFTGLLMMLETSAQTQSRLIGQARFDYDMTNGFELADTFAYQYSGGRGSDMKTGVYKYDTSVQRVGSQLKERVIQTFYYPSEQLQVSITQNDNNGQWENYSKLRYYYNAQGTTDSVLQESWNPFNKIWQPAKRSTYMYDGGGKLTEYMEETWDNLTAYGPYRRILYLYSGVNRSRATESFWNSGSSGWVGSEEHRYISDANGKVASDSLQVWDNTNMVWQHEYRTTYTYDGGGKLATLTEKDWDPVALNLVSDYKHKYVYNTQNLPEYDSLFAWDNGMSGYIKSRLYVRTYDAAGNITTNEEQYIQNDTFRNYHRKVWTYNSYNQPLLYNAYQWDATGKVWGPLPGNDTRIRYTYQEYDPTGIEYARTGADALKIYPNPAMGMVHIYVPGRGDVDVHIYSLNGTLVKEWQAADVQYNVAIPVYDIAPGQYLLRVRKGDKQMTQQLLIAR